MKRVSVAMKRVCFDIDISVRNWKVVDFLNRALEKSYYYFRSDFDRQLTETNVDLSDGHLTILASNNHRVYRDLYLRDVPIRQTDDYIDLTLYPKTPLPSEEIQRTINNFRENYPSLSPVAELFQIELEFQAGNQLESPEDRLYRGMELSSADFNIFFNLICERFGSKLSEADLRLSRDYLEAFQAILDFIHDIYQLSGDIATNEFNPLLAADSWGIKKSVFTNFIDEKLLIMSDSQSEINDNNHQLFLRETTDYWENKINNDIAPILDEFYDDDDYLRSITMLTQI